MKISMKSVRVSKFFEKLAKFFGGEGYMTREYLAKRLDEVSETGIRDGARLDGILGWLYAWEMIPSDAKSYPKSTLVVPLESVTEAIERQAPPMGKPFTIYQDAL